MTQPRILLFDIETMAAKVYTWGQYQTNVIATDTDWYMLSFAYKWADEDEVHFERKSKKLADDAVLVSKLWKLLDEADIVVAHNGFSFDTKMANSRFFELGMAPPSPYITVDPKRTLSKKMRNYSNKLDEISRRLGTGRKLAHQGFELWLGAQANDPEAWRVMEAYNRHDVELLEEVWLMLRPWIDEVNMTHWTPGSGPACRYCGSLSGQKRGVRRTNASVFQLWWCKDCGGWTRFPKRISQASMR